MARRDGYWAYDGIGANKDKRNCTVEVKEQTQKKFFYCIWGDVGTYFRELGCYIFEDFRSSQDICIGSSLESVLGINSHSQLLATPLNDTRERSCRLWQCQLLPKHFKILRTAQQLLSTALAVGSTAKSFVLLKLFRNPVNTMLQNLLMPIPILGNFLPRQC